MEADLGTFSVSNALFSKKQFVACGSSSSQPSSHAAHSPLCPLLCSLLFSPIGPKRRSHCASFGSDPSRRASRGRQANQDKKTAEGYRRPLLLLLLLLPLPLPPPPDNENEEKEEVQAAGQGGVLGGLLARLVKFQLPVLEGVSLGGVCVHFSRFSLFSSSRIRSTSTPVPRLSPRWFYFALPLSGLRRRRICSSDRIRRLMAMGAQTGVACSAS